MAEDAHLECLADQIMADIFGLKRRVTTVGWYSILLYYDHLDRMA